MKQAFAQDDSTRFGEAMKVLFCGGAAGVVTWASIFPLGTLHVIYCDLPALSACVDRIVVRCRQNSCADVGPQTFHQTANSIA